MIVPGIPGGVRTYPPIKDFGLIGDLHTAALVSKNGSIDWCCWPDFDSPAVFCKLLDAELGGSFATNPLNNFVSSQRYLDGTNVLQTVFETNSGKIRLSDFMPVGRLAGGYIESPPVTRRAISRLIEGLSGEVEVEVNFRPTFNYARAKTGIEPCYSKGHTARQLRQHYALHRPWQVTILSQSGSATVHINNSSTTSSEKRLMRHFSITSVCTRRCPNAGGTK